MNITKPKIHKKYLIVVLIIIFIVSVIAFYFNQVKNNIKVPVVENNNPAIQAPEVKKDKQIHIAAMGDMLAHDTIITNAKNGDKYDFSKFFVNIRPSYQDADVVFCNQEGLSSGSSFGISGYPSFNAPEQFAVDLQSGAGCNAINLANNHMGDKGIAATNATIDVWAGLKPLMINGANKDSVSQKQASIAEVKGIKVGFVSFADFNNNSATPGYSINNYHDESLVNELITDARKKSDVVIVSMHWGVEDSNTVSADQYKMVNLLSSLGVDVIIGTGPHVLQKFETVKRPDGGNMSVWYSIGNMLSSQLNIDELIGGIAEFDVIKDADNKITLKDFSFTPTYMHYEWTQAESNRSDLLARKNAMIYLLDSADDPLSRSLFNTSVAVQKQYVVDTIGSEVLIK